MQVEVLVLLPFFFDLSEICFISEEATLVLGECITVVVGGSFMPDL
jgi:hypothetical protein